MQRSKEKLSPRRREGSPSQKAGIVSNLRERLGLNLQSRWVDRGVKAGSLALEATTVCLDDALPACAIVKDGMEVIENPGYPATGAAAGSALAAGAAREVRLIGDAAVFDVALQGEGRVCTREEPLSFAAPARTFALSFKNTGVRAADSFLTLVPKARDGRQFLIQDPVMPVSKYEISKLPHTIRGVGVETLKDSECKSFLREAEALKGIPAESAELLAVFRHVPIEVISRLRFIEEGNVISYGISPAPRPTSTRVHDMAAVRDEVSGEIYLIPHRTRFRAVSLS